MAGVPKRHPRLDSYKRTWYFLRRNTLAMFGLGVILFFVFLAIFAVSQPIPWYNLPSYCATDQTNPTQSTSSASTLSISQPLANGVYAYSVQPPTGFTVSPSAGTLQINGADVTKAVVFTKATTTASAPAGSGGLTAASMGAPGSLYNVTFTETGLPSGFGNSVKQWGVTLNFTSNNLCTPSERQVCTYPQGSIPPGPNCYQTATNNPSEIPPTVNLAHLSSGPLPFGSMTLSASQPGFYDVFTWIIRGSDWSLLIATTIVLAGATIGLLVGAIAGFFGGVVDEALMRLVDVFLSIPQVLFIIVVIAVVTLTTPHVLGLSIPDTRLLLLILGFMVTWWPFYARIVRGQVLVVREQKYVEAARASGAGKGRIVRRHILPNSVYPVFIQMSLDVGTIPLLLGVLVFLGFQIFPSLQFPEWGDASATSVADLQSFLLTCTNGGCVVPWWQLFFPGVTVFLFAISVNFLSDGLRDALDPRLRR